MEPLQSKQKEAPLPPFCLPIVTGFQRSVVERCLNKRVEKNVVYTSTNLKHRHARGLSNYEELHNFLVKERIAICIDYFTFNPSINTSLTLQCDHWSSITLVKDFAKGLERYPVAVVNCIDNEIPVIEEYIMENEFPKGNNPDLSSTCCKCIDNCKDKLNCPCFQLTLANYDPDERKKMGDNNIGYEYKRLFKERKTLSGIFECNANCKCNTGCLNRVVQTGTKWWLQIFKTNGKGWGVRTLNDIPCGAFVASYTGVILEDGLDLNLARNPKRNDKWKYLLALNVTRNNTQPAEPKIKKISQQRYHQIDVKNICTLMNCKRKLSRKVYRFSNQSSMKNVEETAPKQFCPQKSYVLDSHLRGNIGRFFNHSCEPNMFPQSVFVDTHDLNFPCISFFAAKDIPAGDELTWCYNYEFDESLTTSSGRIPCLCGSYECYGILC